MRTSIALMVSMVIALIGIQILASPLVDSTTKSVKADLTLPARSSATVYPSGITCAVAASTLFGSGTASPTTCALSIPTSNGASMYQTKADGQPGSRNMAGANIDGFSIKGVDASWTASSTTVRIQLSAITPAMVTSSATEFAITGIPATKTGNGAVTPTAASGSVSSTYLTEDDSAGTGVNAILFLIPFLVIIGVITGALATTGHKAYGALRGEGAGATIADVLVLVVGVVLVPVIIVFVNGARGTYEVLPDFTGVGTVLGLVVIAYVLNLLGQGVAAAAPAVRSIRG